MNAPAGQSGLVLDDRRVGGRARRHLVAFALALACSPLAPSRHAAASCGAPAQLVVYWAVGCPHCEAARPAVAALIARHPGLSVEWVEIRNDAVGRARFLATTKRLGIEGAGVPMFVAGNRVVVGFREGDTEGELDEAVRGALADSAKEPPRTITLPLFGALDPSRMSFALLTVLVGLADGINPCAFYVLIVLLGLLLRTRSRRRIALYGGVFVVMSGAVYFLFMTAWLGLFLSLGGSRYITLALGALLVGMGLVNLKELVWFHRGASLMIPTKAKPGLFRRMRGIADAASLPAAFFGICLLAFVVNLVELGCTLGLPAIYTRLLSLRAGLSPAGRYAYLVLYNAVYVLPLALIVAVYVLSLRRLALTERRAKVLKAVSGALLLAFGVVFLAAPDVLR